jgi:V8-like Glu-specific endopeptidase
MPLSLLYREHRADLGPDFRWQGPDFERAGGGAEELQSWFQPDSEAWDVGFLKRAMENVPSVCRIEVKATGEFGTGFVVGPGLVLTNYHVFGNNSGMTDQQHSENARSAILRFGLITASSQGDDTPGQEFRLDQEQPVVKSSPAADLDYDLLRVDKSILGRQDFRALEFSSRIPREKESLHILQHPKGKEMQLASSTDAITGLYGERLQYFTRAWGGSSGSPCFNDEWKVVALHHAQRSRAFGTVREGILFSRIYQEIKEYLR